MYRATLILWADSICKLDPNFQNTTAEKGVGGGVGENLVAIDQLTPEDPMLIAYLWNGEGVGVLTRLDGGSVSLDKPGEVLGYTVKNIESGFSSRVGDGIKRKVLQLDGNWNLGGGDLVDVGVNGGIGVGVNAASC